MKKFLGLLLPDYSSKVFQFISDGSVLTGRYSSNGEEVPQYLRQSTASRSLSVCTFTIKAHMDIVRRLLALLFLPYGHQVAKCRDPLGLHGDALGAGIVVELQREASLVVGLHARVPIECSAIVCRVGQSCFRIVAMIIADGLAIALECCVASAVTHVIGWRGGALLFREIDCVRP